MRGGVGWEVDEAQTVSLQTWRLSHHFDPAKLANKMDVCKAH